MDVQAAPPPFAAKNTGPAPAGNPPVLGQQVPGRSGGLPAQGGLSVLANPMAKELQSYGRGEDTMLVHMTPEEVNSLQGLAMAHGGSLTINPHTGLPEAGWLGKLLPTILGAVGMAFGIPPVWMGALGAVGGTVATGDLGKGLSMGLQAFGGASLGGAAGIGGKLGNVGQSLGLSGSGGISGIGAAKNVADNAITVTRTGAQATNAANAAVNAAQAGTNAATKGAGLLSKFGQSAQLGVPGGIASKAAPMLAASGVMSGISNATAPTGGYATSTGQIDNSYQGPYRAQERKATFAPTTEELLSSTKQRKYYNVDVPEISDSQGRIVQPGSQTAQGTMIYQNVLNPNAKKGEPMYTQVARPFGGPATPAVNDPMGLFNQGYAHGGAVDMRDGAFVVDARTVSELGNGSSNAGMELLSRMGGHPVRGPGDGVSDSVPASIGGKQEARVARDEVIFQPDAVRRLGKGSEKRGTQKLYDLMDKAHKARKNAKRGQDTGVRKGLA